MNTVEVISEVVVRPAFPHGRFLETILAEGATNYSEVRKAAVRTEGGTNQERLDVMVDECCSQEAPENVPMACLQHLGARAVLCPGYGRRVLKYGEVCETAAPAQESAVPGSSVAVCPASQDWFQDPVEKAFSEVPVAENVAMVCVESAVPGSSVAVCPVTVSASLMEAASATEGHMHQLEEATAAVDNAVVCEPEAVVPCEMDLNDLELDRFMESGLVTDVHYHRLGDLAHQLMVKSLTQNLAGSPQQSSQQSPQQSPQQLSSRSPRPLTPRTQYSQASLSLPSVGPSLPDVDDLLDLSQGRPLSPILSGNCCKRSMSSGGNLAKKLARPSPSGGASASLAQAPIFSQSADTAQVQGFAGLFSRTVQEHGEWEQKARESGQETTRRQEELEQAKTQRQTDQNIHTELSRQYQDLRRQLQVQSGICSQNEVIVKSLRRSRNEVVELNAKNESQLRKCSRKLAELRKIFL